MPQWQLLMEATPASLQMPQCAAGPLLYWRPAGVLLAFPVVAYGFTTHHFIFVIYSSLKSPSVKRMTLVAQKVRPLTRHD